MPTKRKIYLITLKAACLVGCLLQVTEILKRYLAYNTTTHIAVHVPEILYTHDVSYCIRTIDIFDHQSYERRRKVKLNFKQDNDNFNAISLLNNVLVKDIYDFTPNATDL